MSKGISFSVDDILKRDYSSNTANLRDFVSSVDKSSSPSSVSSINHLLLNNECKSVSSSPVSGACIASSSSLGERMPNIITATPTTPTTSITTAAAAASNQHSSPYDTRINNHYSSHHLHQQLMHHTSPATSSSSSFISSHHLRSHSHEHLWSLLNHSAAAAAVAAASTVTSKVNNFSQSTTGNLLNGRSHDVSIENYSLYKSSGSDFPLKHHHHHQHHDQMFNSISFNHLPHLLYRQPIISGPSQSDQVAPDGMSSSSSSSNCYSSAHTSSHLRGLMVQSTSPSSASSSSSTIPSTLPQFTSSDLNVINNSASNSNQVHPIFAISPASGITYSWISPPKSLPRKRTVFSRSQRIELEKKFQAQKYISKSERVRFARELGLKDSQVKVWFINRRTKWRNDREKRLMIKCKVNNHSNSSDVTQSITDKGEAVAASN